MRIHELKVRNFKRVEAVTIPFPDAGTVEICGKNGSGKTSCIDALWAALAGTKASPEQPIRNGARGASVALDLGDLHVRREWDGKGTRLTVTGADGAKMGRPQELLDGLFARLAFDPMDFTRQRPAIQAATLRQVAGLDFTAIDERRSALAAERTEVGKAVKRQEAIVADMPEVEAADEVSAADLSERLQQASRHNVAVAAARRDADRKSDRARAGSEDVDRLGKRLEDSRAKVATLDAERIALSAKIVDEIDTEPIRREIAALEARLREAIAINEATARSRREEARKLAQVEDATAEIASLEGNLRNALAASAKADVERDEALALVGDEIDTAPILEQIAGIEQSNRRARQYRERKAAVEALRANRSHAEELGDRIEQVDAERHAMLSSAPFPVPGLSLDGDVVTFDGIPFSQISTAEQIRVSLAMSAALNPTLRLVVIREGSLLDSGSLQLVAEWAEEHGYQVIVERVADSAVGCGVVIEEGLVKEHRERALEAVAD